MDALSESSQRPLGKTGIKLSALGFGASPLGNEFGAVEESEGIAAVHAAISHNVNYFDVSPYYGRTRAETVLGKALSSIPRENFVLSTKVGRYDTDEFDFSAARVRRSVTESMARLGVEYLDIVFVHDAEFGDLDVVVGETIPELVKLREAGVIRAVGVSGYPLEMFAYVVAACAPGSVDAVLSYCNYTLQNDRLRGVADFLRRSGVGVINASPLCMGLLTASGGPAWHPADGETKAAAREAARVAAERGADVSDVAMKFAFGGGFDSTLVGIDSRATLQKNLRVLKEWSGGDVDGGVDEEVGRVFDAVKGRRWESGYFKAFP